MNDNYLKGMKCPTCGSEGPFRIEMTAEFAVTDEGLGDIVFEERKASDPCQCVGCQHRGTTHDFCVVRQRLRDYNVEWQFTGTATSPEAAAMDAWEAMRAMDSIANVFDVTDEEGETVRVDLQEVLEDGRSSARDPEADSYIGHATLEQINRANRKLEVLGAVNDVVVNEQARVATKRTGDVFVQAWVQVKSGANR